MARTLFARGARGASIEDLQAGLIGSGIPLASVDGDFGPRTEAAVLAYQTAHDAPRTGSVSEEDWTALTGRPLPPLFDRCLQITAAFEGHDYTVAAGNWDGAWLTWGIIGFTLAFGRVQRIVRAVHAAAPGRLDEAFGALASELLDVMSASSAGQQAWADRISSADKRTLVEPWQRAFARFGSFREVQEAQRQCAFDDYFRPAARTAADLALTTELGIALCFDIHVQNGGVRDEVRRALPPFTIGAPERPRREAVANGVADHARERFRENVRRRKLAIATGTGTANGLAVVLSNWGLADIPAVI